MLEIFRRPVARAVAVIVGVGVVLGAVWAVLAPLRVGEEPGGVPLPQGRPPSFADSFVHFFPGRTYDGTRPKPKKQLLRADKFVEGEQVGFRAQTAPAVTRSFVVELRFLAADTREESPALARFRQRFRIRPGLRTYCCLRIPDVPGRYVIGIVLQEALVSFLPIEVKASQRRLQGGLFQRVEEE